MKNILLHLVVISVQGLLIIGSLLFVPPIFEPTFAADDPASARVEIDFDVRPYLKFTPSSNNVNIALTHDNLRNETLTTSTQSIELGTNNETGYTLMLTTLTDDTSLTNSSHTIPSITSDTPASAFSANQWGFSLDATNYQPIRGFNYAGDTTISATEIAGNSSTSITVGVKANLQLTAGSYTNTLLYTMVANLVPEPPFGGITTMQEMTPDICSATSAGATKSVTDSRDDNSYVIKKLADGRCWMTENLRLGGSSPITLKNTDTNMAAATWILPASTTDNDTFDYVEKGFTTPGVNADSKNVEVAMTGSSPAGKVGNYYNYCAASAGTYCYEEGAGTGNATSDICPKGWHMPTGGDSGEYKALYTAYSNNVANFQSALSTPLSGHFAYGAAGNQGTGGRFWSSTFSSTENMYLLRVSSSNVYPTTNELRYFGYALRCVASN